MEYGRIKRRLTEFVSKYRYVTIVLLVGAFLMLLPPRSGETQTQPEKQLKPTEESLELKLGKILAQVDGVGKVQVMLTEAAGESVHYQSDEDISSDGGQRSQTVVITNESRAEQGLIKSVSPPVYLGAVVVCQGADRPSVRLAVTEAVANVTGISTDKITVLKMK
jgi:stage III sporulation protein AG